MGEEPQERRGFLPAGDGCACSAGVRTGLGFEDSTSGWTKAFDELLMASGVDGMAA